MFLPLCPAFAIPCSHIWKVVVPALLMMHSCMVMLLLQSFGKQPTACGVAVSAPPLLYRTDCCGIKQCCICLPLRCSIASYKNHLPQTNDLACNVLDAGPAMSSVMHKLHVVPMLCVPWGCHQRLQYVSSILPFLAVDKLANSHVCRHSCDKLYQLYMSTHICSQLCKTLGAADCHM